MRSLLGQSASHEKGPAASLPGSGPDDGEELFGLKARAADQRTIYIWQSENFARIRGLHGPAIKDRHETSPDRETAIEPLANELVHLPNLAACRRTAAADRPNGLIGYRGCVRLQTGWNACIELGQHNLFRLSGVVLLFGLADANDGQKPGPPSGFGLGGHHHVRLAMIMAPLGMAHDHCRGTCIGKHFGTYVAGEGARQALMAVLPAYGDTAPGRGDGPGKEREGRADEHIGVNRVACDPACHRHDVRERRPGPVHFPVSGDQRPHAPLRFGLLLQICIPYHPPFFAARESFSMLQQMRNVAKSKIATIGLGLLALSFGLWGIADIFRGNVDTSIATVGGEKISADIFQRDYRNFLRSAGNQLGHDVSAEEAHAKGLDKQALETTLSRTAIDQVVSRYGLRATDAEVADAIRAIPAFRGPLGAFDHETFLDRIQAAGFTEDGFVDVERHDIARNQLIIAIHDGFALPPGYTSLIFDYVEQHRAANYVVVPKEAAGTPPTPTDAELDAYIRSHPSEFSTPEYRDVTYAVASPQDVMNQVHVTDQELQQQYELRKDQYQIPEKRDVEQIVFPDEASAKAASAKIAAGTGFDQIAFQRGLKSTDTSLGTVVEADLGKDRGPPTFALPVGGVTQPIKSAFGWVLLHVTKITPGLNKSFADVKVQLRKDVLNQLATAKLTDVTNAFDDASAGGAALPEAARRAGMHVVHIPAVDKNGLTPAGTKANLPASPDFLAQLQKSEVGEEGDPFPSTDNNVYVIKVNGVTPPKLKPLAAVREQALADWTADWKSRRLASMAKELVGDAAAAKNLAVIAAKMNTSVQSTGAITRNSKVPGMPADLVRDLFNSPPGKIVSSLVPNGGLVIAQVIGVSQPTDPMGNPMFFQLANSLSNEAADDIDNTFAMAARAREGVSVNQTQVDRVTGGG